MREAARTLLQEPQKGHRRLAEAMREVKSNAADRADVIVDIREASLMRLELLAHELEPVFAEVPADAPLFDFVISSGEQPRLWIDAVAHVALGRDRRTYSFVRDTRTGRVVMAESAEMEPVVKQITLYIAERLVERQRMIDGDVKPLADAPSALDAPSAFSASARPGQSRAIWAGVLYLVIGALVGAGTIIALHSDRFPEVQRLFLN